MSSAYFSRTTFLFSFNEGVTSPESGVQSSGTMIHFLTCSTGDTPSFASSTARSTSSLTRGSVEKLARSWYSTPLAVAHAGASSWSSAMIMARNLRPSPTMHALETSG